MSKEKARAVQSLYNLKKSLVNLVGYKRYMSSIEIIFDKMEDLDLSPAELEALRYLSQDLREVKLDKSKARFGVF